MSSTSHPRPRHLAIIGAGAAGLCVARALDRAGIPYEQLERHTGVGGMWDSTNPWSAIYESAHMISSRRSTQLTDFPMAGVAADYPHHSAVAAYFRDFARRFGLIERIRFGAAVEWVAPRDGAWDVKLAGEELRRYRGVVIANGHQSEPSLPEFPGRFDGEAFHSLRYKSPRVFAGKRVLVVGGGNSGADIVLDAVHHGARAFLSMRRGYHVVPKYALFGIPMGDLGGSLPLPPALERRLARFVLRLLVGDPRRLGLPLPDHAPFERHAIVSSQLLYHLGHGDLTIKPNVAELCGDHVRFADGSAEAVDVIVYATGYRVSFPFLDPSLLTWSELAPELYLHAFHPRHDDLFVAGMVESVDGGNWRLFAAQAELIAAFVAATEAEPERAAAFRRLKSEPGAYRSGCARPYYVRNRHYLAAVDRAMRLLSGGRPLRRAQPAALPHRPAARA